MSQPDDHPSGSRTVTRASARTEETGARAGRTTGVRAVETTSQPAKTRKAQRRHARVVIRKVGPWSVFKMSLIFYFCVMLVLLGAGVILYGMLGAIGALDSTTRLIRDLFADPSFVINGRWLFSRGLTIGLVMVVVWSLINVFIAFLYNLISDLVGGIEVTLAERR
jgi:hypothetical protein